MKQLLILLILFGSVTSCEFPSFDGKFHLKAEKLPLTGIYVLQYSKGFHYGRIKQTDVFIYSPPLEDDAFFATLEEAINSGKNFNSLEDVEYWNAAQDSIFKHADSVYWSNYNPIIH